MIAFRSTTLRQRQATVLVTAVLCCLPAVAQHAGAELPPRPAASATPAAPTTERRQTAGEPDLEAAARPRPSSEPRCKDSGPPARLEVRPSRKLMRPAEQLLSRSAARDASGCLLASVPVAWRLVDAQAAARLLAPGRIAVEDGAPETQVALSASVAGQAVKVVVEVASRRHYQALLQQRGLSDSGESSQAAVAVIASGSTGAQPTVAEDAARTLKLAALVITGGLVVLCVTVGLAVARRIRRRRGSRRPEQTPARRTSPLPPRLEAPLVCPTCRQEYPAGAAFCTADGNRLVPLQETGARRELTGGICPVCGHGFDPGIRVCPRHNEELIPAALYTGENRVDQGRINKICPVCGGQSEGDACFCSADGTSLVPVN
jgi:hypothetical protein